jgi:hypothetical protein
MGVSCGDFNPPHRVAGSSAAPPHATSRYVFSYFAATISSSFCQSLESCALFFLRLWAGPMLTHRTLRIRQSSLSMSRLRPSGLHERVARCIQLGLDDGRLCTEVVGLVVVVVVALRHSVPVAVQLLENRQAAHLFRGVETSLIEDV